jgi:hypothetical protein
VDAEPDVFEVGINFGDAVKLTGASAVEGQVRRAEKAGRYVLADLVASGPAMFDTARLDRAGGIDPTSLDPLNELGRRAATTGLRTATLDEVLWLQEFESPCCGPPSAPDAPDILTGIEIRVPLPLDALFGMAQMDYTPSTSVLLHSSPHAPWGSVR